VTSRKDARSEAVCEFWHGTGFTEAVTEPAPPAIAQLAATASKAALQSAGLLPAAV